ncbi:hypothetical protein KUTeg_011906 [Tegillarca granosa]|uniref:TIR domain-containing protein n=1 Tax=Tegillarca granosa TaxID=220873 RepID=A0ABQ9EY03_TEGGR|nr:hypothetical protein KUTeg_011906 [Tegillarca granosa]
MGCLPSKQSTHVAVVHPLENQPETSDNIHLDSSKDTENKNNVKESESKNEKSQRIPENTKIENITTENKNNKIENIISNEEGENKNEKEINMFSIENIKKKETEYLDDENSLKSEKIKQYESEKKADEENKENKQIDFMAAESNREKSENGAPYEIEKKFKKEFYKHLVTTGTMSIIVEVNLEILKLGYRNETGELIQSRLKPLINSLLVLINFSDSNPEDTHVIVDYPQYLDTLGEKLIELEQKGFAVGEHKSSNKDYSVLKKILSILHNVGMYDDHHDKLHQRNFVQILTPYLESPDKNVSLSSLATLADIIIEEESGIIQTNPKILNALMNRLNKALKNKGRREGGWSVCELCRNLIKSIDKNPPFSKWDSTAIRRIARNDANKKALVNHNAAEILVKVAADGHVDEQREAVGALRTLSFNKSNQQLFVTSPDLGVIETFITLRNSPDKEVRKTCEGALWTLRDLLCQHEKYKDSVKNIPTRVSHQSATSQGHIMISYQWGNQPMMIKIKDILKSNGFKVWIDIDDMEGSTLNAMASAVEKASVVLICYSQKYKDSDNLTMTTSAVTMTTLIKAEYAFQLKKKIVPLKMEKNFKPDGWLGFIIGSKLFFDFSGKYSFESKIEGLLRELHAKLGDDKDTPDHLDLTIPKVAATVDHHPEPMPVSSKTATTSLAPVPTNTEVVKKWTNDQVKQWLDKHSLDKSKFSKITGIEIAFLQIVRKEGKKIKQNSPDFFYKSLTDMLKITDLLTMSKFVFALEDTNI